MPSSPCATNTSTVPSDLEKFHSNFADDSIVNISHGNASIKRFPSDSKQQQIRSNSLLLSPPSPSRSTLDPEYAKRLVMSSHTRHSEIDTMSLSPPVVHKMTCHSSSVQRQPSNAIIFHTPEVSLSSSGVNDDEDDEKRDEDETVTFTNNMPPSSNNTEFHTPERATNMTTSTLPYTYEISSSSLEGISSIVVPRLPSKASYGEFSHKQYYTPQNSPRRSGDSMRRICSSPDVSGSLSTGSHPRLRSSLNRSINRNSNDKSVIPGRNFSEYHRSDRFIPSRLSSNLHFPLWNSNESKSAMNGCASGPHEEASQLGAMASGGTDRPNSGSDEEMYGTGHVDATPTFQHAQYQSQQPPLFNALLRSELLGENIDPTPVSPTAQNQSSGLRRHHHQGGSDSLSIYSSFRQQNCTPLREGGNFLRYHHNSRQNVLDELHGGGSQDPTSAVNSLSLSPVGMASSNRLSSMSPKCKRRIAKVPFKVLDAPELADDFYLNLVDWSLQNVLAVGLGACVYLWSARTSKVTKLCDLGLHTRDAVTSVSWTQQGLYLAVGAHNGEVQIWDTIECRKIRTMAGHSVRVGALSWSGPILATGSRDRLIYLRDVRSSRPYMNCLAVHKQEVCGLKWSFDEPAHLASGGNDNKLLVWDIKHQRRPAHKFTEHIAAVKAIAWSPHQHGLLASGGGTADRCIRFWNTVSGLALNAVDTESQVCNLVWSRNCNELVSTHGYSLNQIIGWKYPTMQKVATLTGHTYRVLYLAMSPDGSTIVTGAGDETLRFWQVFPGRRSHSKTSGNGLLFPSSHGSILR